jgi:hypothetical protein
MEHVSYFIQANLGVIEQHPQIGIVRGYGGIQGFYAQASGGWVGGSPRGVEGGGGFTSCSSSSPPQA